MANIQTNTRNTYYAVLALTEQSQNSAANSTTLAYTLTLYNGKTSFSGYTIGYRVKIDGVQVAYHDNSGAQTSMGWNEAKLLVSGTTTVLHDDNGNKTVSVEIEVWTDVNQYLPIYISGSGTVALTQILRESTISATDANIGAVSMIAVNRKSSGYTHSIAYTFGALSGYITADGGVSPTEIKLSATYIGWTIPVDFYGMIPNNKIGDCTLTCRTYSGDTQIGSAKTFTIRCTAAESLCAPVVSGTVVDTNEAVTALTGSSAKLVRYISNALCTISAAARNSATLKQKRIAGQAITDTSRTISAMELESVIFDATDSRGYTSTAVVAVDLVPYIKLTCRAVTARLTPTGDKVQLDISGSYFNGSFGVADNELTIKYRVSGASAWQEITPVIDGNNYTASVVLSGLAYNQTHTLSISAADKLSTVQISDTVKRGVPIFDWGEEDFEFHVPVSFQGKSMADLIYPVGSIYMSAENTNPHDIFGGTWKQIGGRTLIGAGPNEANTTNWWGSYDANKNNFPAGEMGGTPSHALTVDELPAHGHGYWKNQQTGSPQVSHGAWEWYMPDALQFSSAGTHLYIEASDAGGGAAHNNMPPYYVVYIWQRTA